MALTDEDGNGCSSPECLVFSFCLPYTVDQLENIESRFSIPQTWCHDFVDVNLDLRQMGVGGNDSWGAKPP